MRAPLMPLRDVVVFPSMVAPLFVGRDRSVAALEYAMEHGKTIFLATQREAKVDEPREGDIYQVGTLSTVLQLLRLPDGTVKALIEGRERARIMGFQPNPDFFMVDLEVLDQGFPPDLESEALIRSVVASFDQYAKLNKKIPKEVLLSVSAITDPGALSDTVVGHLPLKLDDKQQLLELIEPNRRLSRLFELLRSEIEILQIERRIKSRVKRQMEKTQREYYLNEQMRAIQKEMGEKDDLKSEVRDLEEKLKKKPMPREARQKVEGELKKLKMMSPMSAEATVVRNYVDWLMALPWRERTRDVLDLKAAHTILDEDHYGLEKPKERILEFLAVQALTKKIKGPILCFVGPPGVGKTSLARSIARAMGRNFIRVSLGGVRDEAEIRGHRRTYIGAMPGRIIQGLKQAGTNNPVFMLDEVDKVGADYRGDPTSALLEVLDPEQNFAFSDHYLNLPYDLSKVMFITTANVEDTIPEPLWDRMEVIELGGYTEEDKLAIAKGFLIPRQRKEAGLDEGRVAFSEGGLLEIIRSHTREAGLRNLEREIGSVCRKVARKVAEGFEGSYKINAGNLERFLGVPKFLPEDEQGEGEVGVATGLAWTAFGGEVLRVEVSALEGKGNLTITGSLGEVMRESAQAALSYARSRAAELGLKKGFYEDLDLHVHVPSGAIPKDGPSAGITLATAIISALTGVPVKEEVAMTGEVTLTGKVLPIGGLKEKSLAALRAGMALMLVPEKNHKDIKELPQKVKRKIKIVSVKHMDEVLPLVLAKWPLDKPARSRKKSAPKKAKPAARRKAAPQKGGRSK